MNDNSDLVSHSGRVRPRLRLRTKLLLGVLAAAVIAVVTQFALSYVSVTRTMATMERQRVTDDLALARGALARLRLELENVTLDSASTPDLAKAVLERRGVWIDLHVAAPLVRTYGYASAEVFVNDGRVLAAKGDSLPASLVADEGAALRRGEVSSRFASASGRLWLIAAAPVQSSNSGQRTRRGSLIVAQSVDDHFAQALARLAGTNVSFVDGGRADFLPLGRGRHHAAPQRGLLVARGGLRESATEPHCGRPTRAPAVHRGR